MSNPSLEMLSSGINAGKNLKKTPKEFKNIPIVKCITHNPIWEIPYLNSLKPTSNNSNAIPV